MQNSPGTEQTSSSNSATVDTPLAGKAADNAAYSAAEFPDRTVKFEQAGETCAALVAWWARRRLKSKSFWKSKDFEQIGTGTAETIYVLKQVQSSVRGAAKVKALQDAYPNHSQSNGYVISGDFEGRQGPRRSKLNPTVLHTETKMAGHINKSSCSELKRAMNRTCAEGAVTIFSIESTTEGLNHVVGLDGISDNPVYFDPNLGEFHFTNADALGLWWETCYKKYSGEKSAFGIFKTIFFENRFNVMED